MSSSTLLCYLVCAQDGGQFRLHGGESSTWSLGKLTAELPKEMDSLRFCIDFRAASDDYQLVVTWKLSNERVETWSATAPPDAVTVAGRYWSPLITRDEVKDKLAVINGQGSYPVPVVLVISVFGPVTVNERTGETAETSAAQVLKPPCTVYIRPRLEDEVVA